MEPMNKARMQEIIKRQEEELARYKLRFQDLVAAHKGLIKEKKTLETSLKVMSRAPANTAINKSAIDNENKSDISSNHSSEKLQDETSKSEDNTIDSNKVSSNEDSTSNSNLSCDDNNKPFEELQSRVNTLMKSLATLSEEKSRMEAGFQADKKALRSEKDMRDRVIADLRKELELNRTLHQNEIDNYKSKILIERHEREKEHHDHGVMIRELQKLLAEERSTREKAEGSVEDVRQQLFVLNSSIEQKERELTNQVDHLKNRLGKEKELSSPMVALLQEEMNALKQQHLLDLQREQERVIEAEERAKALAAMHEERVSNLEARLAELSETVGNYDRRRQADIQAITRLKDRLIQLEVEQGDEKVKGDKEMDVLVDELKQLKMLIETANRTSDKPIIDIYSILFDQNETVYLSKYANSDHTICNEEYRLLKDEFENYKLQSQTKQLLYSPKTENPSEIEQLKKKVKSLMEKIHVLQMQLESGEASFKEKIEESQKTLKHEKIRSLQKLSSCEQDHRARVTDLELQLSKQRERALALVQEKDDEIAALKTSFHSLLPTPNTRLSLSSDKDSEPTGSNSVGLDMVESRPMLHYVQELARLQVDIKKLRKQKHTLESLIRDQQLTAAEERECLSSQINDLSNEVARLERCQTREGANLEYLKNVVLSYLLTSDERRKSHMLNAIAAVLQFSDSEKIKVSHTAHHKVTPIH